MSVSFLLVGVGVSDSMRETVFEMCISFGENVFVFDGDISFRWADNLWNLQK